MMMIEVPQQKIKKRHYVGWILFALMAVAMVIAIILNRVWIYDWYRGLGYEPTSDMTKVRDGLGLTARGRFLFDASRPELNNTEEFNKNCRQDESEMAVLGCYTVGTIYVYNITAEELNGIRELTTAHELLHAVWARMSDSEKSSISSVLESVYNNNLGVLQEDVAVYGESERMEELFVRAGTEIKKLPNELERIYGEVFVDQDRIVDYYDGYIAVFRTIREEMEKLENDMEVVNTEIQELTGDYEKRASQLEADIVSFNSCAEVAGCFQNEEDFYDRRDELVARQNELEELNERINALINEYNKMVEEYNNNVTESHKLQNLINSSKKIKL